MADWKTLEEANNEYDKLTEIADKATKDKEEAELKLTAAEENAAKDSEKIKALEKELKETKKVNYALSMRGGGQEKKTAEQMINNLFFGGEQT